MRLAIALCFVSTVALANVVTLDATTETLELETSSASSTDYAVSWMDNASGTLTPGSTTGNVASATDTTIVAAPGASTQRAITVVKVCNAGSTAQTVRLLHDTSGTERMLSRAVLAASECAVVSRAQLNPGVRIYNDTCFALAVIGGVATTAPSFNSAVVELMER